MPYLQQRILTAREYERLQKAQYNGLWGVEMNLLRIIEGKMLAMVVFWKLGYEDTLLHGDTLISVSG